MCYITSSAVYPSRGELKHLIAKIHLCSAGYDGTKEDVSTETL